MTKSITTAVRTARKQVSTRGEFGKQLQAVEVELRKLQAENRRLEANLTSINTDHLALWGRVHTAESLNEDLKLLVAAYQSKAALYRRRALVLKDGLDIYASATRWSTNDDGENVFHAGTPGPGHDIASRVLAKELVRSVDA